MSFLLQCPNCGLRQVQEFRYGGELCDPPEDSSDQAQWTDYVYNRSNLMGLQREWWYHQSGCRRWFVAERDVMTNQVRATFWYHAQ